MFSGIIQSIEKISSFNGNLLVVEASEIANKNDISESISVNGACLTIVDKSSTTFSVNVVEETLKRTNLGKLSVGSNVNLESALRVGDKIGGHNVQGHVDCTTTIKKITKVDNSWIVDFHKPEDFSHYLIEKGFITIDGASLTITNDIEEYFSIAVIPFTWSHTIFSGYEVGSVVNLEVDMTAKYIEKIINKSRKVEKGKLKMKLNTIEEAIQDYKDGKFVIIVDDEDRENEGDITLAADFITPEKINFMALNARGLICVAIDGKILNKLNIPLMVDESNDSNYTAFTVSIDYIPGTTTGISADDRSKTVKGLIDDAAESSMFQKPDTFFRLSTEKVVY